jgi:hypothetical protein
MELDDKTKEAVRELGDAINQAVEKSERVADAIKYLREIGFEPNLTLKLEIGLQEISESAADADDVELELTDEDLHTLRRMKIKIDE